MELFCGSVQFWVSLLLKYFLQYLSDGKDNWFNADSMQITGGLKLLAYGGEPTNFELPAQIFGSYGRRA